MPSLELRLFGQPQIFLDGKPTSLQRNKGKALLFYLAVTAAEHSRQALAGLLWELPENRARSNLSVELGDLNDKLDGFLSVQGRQTIAFNQDSDHIIDVARFKRCLSSQKPTVMDLKTAVDLYQGAFLLGFNLKNAPLFEQWVLTEQAQLEPMAFRAIYALAAHHRQQKQYRTAIKYIDHLLGLEPTIEEAHRHKMVMLALNGQWGEALAQYETCRAIFARDNDEPGEETTSLYRRLLAGVIPDDIFPESAEPISGVTTTYTPPFQVPAPTPHFIGREPLIADFRRFLSQPTGRAHAYSLVGMGGIGKTTLAIHIAHELRDLFQDGVLWANVSISDPMNILESWARTFGYDFSTLPDLESRAAAWRSALAEKQTLIILDNVTSVARVRPLLAPNSLGATLLTTRDLDLARALNTNVTYLPEFTPDAGRQLLIEILGENRVMAENKAADEICALLQHLPLAIEIIAQRLKSRPRRTLSAIANRLQTIDNRLAELELSDRAVRASFQLSWETLDGELQRNFSLLAVFDGRSFTADALAAVVELDKFMAEERLFALEALSLVKGDEEGRYQQHPLLADFASEKLGQAPQAHIQMARYYQDFARQHQHDYVGLRPEWENLTAAQEVAFQYEQWPLIIDFAQTLREAWLARGRYDQARRGNHLAYQAAAVLEDQKAEAQFLYQWAHALVEQNLYEEARQLLHRNLEQYQTLSDEMGLADAYYELGRIALEQSRHGEAEKYLEQSKQLRQQSGELTGLAETIEGQARLLYQQGEYQPAYEKGLEALSHYENAGHTSGIIETLRTLANSLIEMNKHGSGDLDEARQHSERALQLAEGLEDRGEQGVTLYVLSRVHLLQGELQQAKEAGNQSLELLERIGHQRSQAIVLRHLGEISYSQEDYATALELTSRSLLLFQKLGAEIEEAVAYSNIGVYHDCLGNVEAAEANWLKALPIAEKLNHTTLVSRLQKRLKRS